MLTWTGSREKGNNPNVINKTTKNLHGQLTPVGQSQTQIEIKQNQKKQQINI